MRTKEKDTEVSNKMITV